MPASPPSHSARLQLVLIRSLLERAASAVDGSDVGSMAALLFADLAVETTIKATLVERNAEAARNATYPQLLESICRAYPELESAPEIGMARRLREARNPVQHAAATVGRGSLEAHLRDAGAVVSLLLEAGFGVDLPAVSVVSLVGDDELRSALEKAQEFCEAGALDDALVCAVATFDSLRIRLGRWIRRAQGIPEVQDRLGPWIFSREVLEVFGAEHKHAVEPTGEWREYAGHALGISIQDQVVIQRARARCEEIRSARGREATPTASPSADEVRKVIERTAQNIWRLESTQPELF